jgi:hypothetical protein
VSESKEELKSECERVAARLWPDSERIDVYMGGRAVIDVISDDHSHHMVSVFDQDEQRAGLAMLAALRVLANEPSPDAGLRSRVERLLKEWRNEFDPCGHSAMADQSPYFLAVKAAHLSALVMERERCNVSVSLEDVRMFRIRAHEVATMAELAETTPTPKVSL